MTSSEIRCKQVRVNFSKTTKLHELVGRVQIAVLKNLQTLSCIKLHPKLCHYLLIINMKKSIQKIKADEIFCLRVITLHSCYMKNALVFSLSEARNFSCVSLFYLECNKTGYSIAKKMILTHLLLQPLVYFPVQFPWCWEVDSKRNPSRIHSKYHFCPPVFLLYFIQIVQDSVSLTS